MQHGAHLAERDAGRVCPVRSRDRHAEVGLDLLLEPAYQVDGAGEVGDHAVADHIGELVCGGQRPVLLVQSDEHRVRGP